MLQKPSANAGPSQAHRILKITWQKAFKTVPTLVANARLQAQLTIPLGQGRPHFLSLQLICNSVLCLQADPELPMPGTLVPQGPPWPVLACPRRSGSDGERQVQSWAGAAPAGLVEQRFGTHSALSPEIISKKRGLYPKPESGAQQRPAAAPLWGKLAWGWLFCSRRVEAEA